MYLNDLHVVCDQSETGYDTCIYVVAHDEQASRTAVLLTAEAKVAPLKAKSIPRLEICAALLGFNLIKSVQKIPSRKISI